MKKSLLAYFIHKKLSALFMWPTIGKHLLYGFSTLLNGLIFGLGFAYLIDSLISAEFLSLNTLLLLNAVIFGSLALSLDFFPQYKRSAILFPAYFPVSTWEKFKLNSLLLISRYYLLFILISQSLIILNSQFIDLLNGLSSIFLILSFYLLNRISKVILDFEISNAAFIWTFSAIILSGILWVNYSIQNYLMFFNSVAFILFSGIYFVLQQDKRISTTQNNLFYTNSILIQRFLKKDIQKLLGIGYLFKLSLLGVFLWGYYLNEQFLLDMELIVWLALSPIFFFTYIANNFYGFNREIVFTHLLREKKIKSLFKIFGKFCVIVLLFDFAIFTLFTSLTSLFVLQNILFYLTLTSILFITAFPISLAYPVLKKDHFSFDASANSLNSSSWIALLISFAAFFSTYLIRFSEYFIPFNLVLVFSVMILNYWALRGINRNKILNKFYHRS